jgi:hypothetical protein
MVVERRERGEERRESGLSEERRSLRERGED